MSIRRFDGSDDRVRTSGSAGTRFTGAVTLAGLIRWSGNVAGSWGTVVATSDDLSEGYSLQIRNDTNLIALYADDSSGANISGMPQDAWCLVAATKAAGTQTPRLHLYDFSDPGWTHSNGGGTVTNCSTPDSSANVDIGRYNTSYAWGGDIAAVGVWNEALTDEQIESLIAGSIADWLGIGTPAGIWAFSQASTATAVLDLTDNNSDQSSLTGTSVVSEDPPIPYESAAYNVQFKAGGSFADAEVQFKAGGSFGASAAVIQ